MPASLRARLALTFAVVVALSLLVAAASLVALLRGYSDRLVQARLDDIAIVVLVQARSMLQRGETPAQVLDFLSEQAERLEVRILLVDRQSRVLRETGRGGSLVGLRIPVDLENIGLPRGQPAQGRFGSPRDGQTYQYAAVPIALAPPRLGDPGVMLIAQPEGSVLATLGSLLPRLALAAGAGLLAGLVAAVLLARWLGRPLAQLLAATRAMSRGDYSQRVPIDGPAELARLSESYNTMAAEVERSRQIVTRFVSTLSHELRTPLTSIRGFAQAILDGSAASPEEQQHAMRIVDREARRMQRLATDLLDLSRLQAGQAPMRAERVDLVELLRQSADVLASRSEESQVRLAFDLPADLSLEGDPDRLEQVFTNLLDNAIKFTPAGGEVRLSACVLEDGPRCGGERSALSRARAVHHSARRFARVDVANPGEPIPPDELTRIFELFYSRADAQQRGGTGLGLPIAREIARAHGGDLVAERAGDQTVFRLELPLEARSRDVTVTPEALTPTA